MKIKTFLGVVSFLCITNAFGQTTKWIKDLYTAQTKTKVIKIWDFNRDGEVDNLLICDNNFYAVFSCFQEKGDTVLLVEDLINEENLEFEFILFDVNSDGYSDIVTYHNGLLVFIPEMGAFEYHNTPFMSQSVESLVCGFVNQDEFADIVINEKKIYYLDNNYFATEEAVGPFESEPYMLADLNGDGFDELILSKYEDDGGVFGSGESSLTLSIVKNRGGVLDAENIEIFRSEDVGWKWNLQAWELENEFYFVVSLGYEKGAVLLKYDGVNKPNATPVIFEDRYWIMNNQVTDFTGFQMVDMDEDNIKDILFYGNWGHLNSSGLITDIIQFSFGGNVEVLPPKPNEKKPQLYACDYFHKDFLAFNSFSNDFYQNNKFSNGEIVNFQKVNFFGKELGLFLVDNVLSAFDPDSGLKDITAHEFSMPIESLRSFSIVQYNDSSVIISGLKTTSDTIVWYKLLKDYTLQQVKRFYQPWMWRGSRFFPVDYNKNGSIDYLIYNKNEVHLSEDTLSFFNTKRVLKQRYFNTSPGNFYITDFNSDGNNEYVMTEYLPVSFLNQNDYTVRFYNSVFELIDEYESIGASDYSIFTDLDGDGNLDMISSMDNIERYYMEGDTILKEELFYNSNFDLNRFYRQPNGKLQVVYKTTSRPYSLISFLGVIIDSPKKFSFEVFQTGKTDVFTLLLLQDSVANWLKIRSDNLTIDNSYKFSASLEEEKPDLLSATFVDYNSDGKTDILYATKSGIYALYGDGSLSFNTAPELLLPESGDFEVADFNADGINDMMLMKWGRNYFYFGKNDSLEFVRLNNFQISELLNFDEDKNFEFLDGYEILEIGNDGFLRSEKTVENRLMNGYSFSGKQIASAKINSDNLTDFFIWKKDTVFALIADGKYDFYEFPIFYEKINNANVYKNDLNNDGFDDLVAICRVDTQPYHYDDSVYVFINKRDGTFFKAFSAKAKYDSYRGADFFNFVGDGKTDIRIYDGNVFTKYTIYENIGNGEFKKSDAVAHNDASFDKNFEDVDSDGNIEFLFVKDGSLSLLQWCQNSPPSLTSDLKTITVGLGKPLKYKLPDNYIVDENYSNLKFIIYKKPPYSGDAPYLKFLPDKHLIVFSNDQAKTVGVFGYKLEVTDVLGEKKIDEFNLEVVETVTNVEALQNIEIDCYPNPAIDFIRLQFTSGILIENCQIYSSDGRIIKNIIGYNHQQINVSSFSPGMYFIEAISGDKRYITKFIKL